MYPEVQKINFIVDNFTTHSSQMFFRHLDLASSLTLCLKINWIFAPVYGSWLNIAEIENDVIYWKLLLKCFIVILILIKSLKDIS